MSADVVCMSLANVPPGEQRSRFLAVGLVDNTVRIISLDPSVRAQLLLRRALTSHFWWFVVSCVPMKRLVSCWMNNKEFTAINSSLEYEYKLEDLFRKQSSV